MGTPIEEHIVEYARGAAAAGPKHASVVVQQVIDLARRDIEILHRACWYCEQNLGAERPDDTQGEAILALLHAALDQLRREQEETSEPEAIDRLTCSSSPKLVTELALALAKEDLDVSLAEKELLEAVHGDVSLVGAARLLALEEFAPGLAAGETAIITALSILEGACRRAGR